MLGAFIGISSAVTHELPVAMAWIFTMVAVAFVGIVFMVLVYFPLRGRPPFLMILTTIARGIPDEAVNRPGVPTPIGELSY
jgi:branched-chain amino acid transport system permease protein